MEAGIETYLLKRIVSNVNGDTPQIPLYQLTLGAVCQIQKVIHQTTLVGGPAQANMFFCRKALEGEDEQKQNHLNQALSLELSALSKSIANRVVIAIVLPYDCGFH